MNSQCPQGVLLIQIPPSFRRWSYLTWCVNVSVSFFPFKIVVLWTQGWILFCSEACAFSKCSMFVEWMDEWAVMRNNTFSCYIALKALLASQKFCGEGGQISHRKGQTDLRLTEIHGIITWHWTPSKVLLVSPTPCSPFLETSQFSKAPCHPCYMRSQDKGVSYKI